MQPLGEVRLFAFPNPPRSWVRCDGRLLMIIENPALYSLLSTNYGGDARSTFAVPNIPPLSDDGPFFCICVTGSYIAPRPQF